MAAATRLPSAEIAHNTTTHLVSDIETLRQLLGVERWLVFGGSWGSTLALAYGQAYPHRCLGFILRGIFLFRPAEVTWFLSGMATFFPEAGRAFREFLPGVERDDVLAAYYRRLTDADPAVHMPAARSWCGYEESCSRLFAELSQPGASASVLAMARIEAHYMAHHGFMEPNQLLANLPRLHGLPVTVVQGRYDVICPIATADDCVRAWPGVDYRVIADAGHSAMEPGIRSALVAAADAFLTRFGGDW